MIRTLAGKPLISIHPNKISGYDFFSKGQNEVIPNFDPPAADSIFDIKEI
jgi:hypothetical protein